MKPEEKRPPLTIRMLPRYLQAAREVAVKERITIGQWLERIIRENVPPGIRKGL